MKTKLLKYLLPLYLITLILLTSCSSQYVEKEFQNKNEYYSTINKAINNRNADVTFMDGNSVGSDNIYVKHDTVYWQNMVTDRKRNLIPLSETKDINIKSYVSQNPVIFNGNVELKNDSIIEVKNAEFLKDTISYKWTHEKKFSTSINNVSSFCYDNHWKGLTQYLFAGMFTGGIIGYKVGSDAGIRDRNPTLGTIAGSILFGLGGMIVGVIIGSPQSYLLKDNDSETYKFFKRFGLLGGMTSSTINGGFSDGRYYITRAMERYTFGMYYLQDISNKFKFRPEVIYNLKGGNYDNYPVTPTGKYFSFIEEGTSALYLNIIEIPLLIEYDALSPRNHFLNLMAGPSINFPFKCELDEYYIGPMDELFTHSISRFNAKPYLSFIYGFGIKWDPHFSTEFMYDKGLTKLGNAKMSDGTRINLQQDDFLITTTFSL